MFSAIFVTTSMTEFTTSQLTGLGDDVAATGGGVLHRDPHAEDVLLASQPNFVQKATTAALKKRKLVDRVTFTVGF